MTGFYVTSLEPGPEIPFTDWITNTRCHITASVGAITLLNPLVLGLFTSK